jgi:hypothetical protein
MSTIEIAIISSMGILVMLTLILNYVMLRKNSKLDNMIDEIERNLEKSHSELGILRKQVQTAKEDAKDASNGSGFGSYEVGSAKGEKIEAEFAGNEEEPGEGVVVAGDKIEPPVKPEESQQDAPNAKTEVQAAQKGGKVNLFIKLQQLNDEELDLAVFKNEVEQAAGISPPSLVVDFNLVTFLLEPELNEIIDVFNGLSKKNIYVYSQNVSEDLVNQFQSKNMQLNILT